MIQAIQTFLIPLKVTFITMPPIIELSKTRCLTIVEDPIDDQPTDVEIIAPDDPIPVETQEDLVEAILILLLKQSHLRMVLRDYST